MNCKQLTYRELVHHVKNCNIKTPWQVVCWLIGFQDVITRYDFNNIARLYMDGIVD